MFDQLARWLIHPSGMTPHCLRQLSPHGAISIHVLAGALAGAAYVAISTALVGFAWQRRGLIHLPLFWLFASFIGLCGLSHWLDTLTLWFPASRLEAVVTAMTAALSVVAALALWRTLPSLLRLPSPAEYTATEEALRQSEGFLRRTGQVARVGGWELDLVTGELIWTTETRRIHGVDRDYRPTVEQALDFYPPEARDTLQAALAAAAAGGPGYDLELPFIRADGSRIWVRTFGSVERRDGKPVIVTGAIQDVTDQVRQRHAMERANQRSILATEAAGIGIWDWNVLTDIVVWDDIMCRLYEAAATKAVDYATWRQYLHPDDRAHVEAALQDGLSGVRSFDTEFRILLPSGTRHMRAIGRTLHDVDGRIERMIGVNWDITEARELAADRDLQAIKLVRSEERFRLIAENANDVISLVDPDGRRSYASPATRRLFGVAPEIFQSRDAKEFIHSDDRAAVAALQGALLSGERTEAHISFRARNPERGEVWIEVNARALTDPLTGAASGYVSVLRDVTDRRAVEAELRTINVELDRLARHYAQARNLAEQANRAKTRFLAGISHELRTPLNGILGYAQLLHMDEALTDKQRERVRFMLTAGKHLLEMISGVLDMSEIESESLELQLAPVELRAVVDACIDMVRPAAEAKHLSIAAAFMPAVPTRTVTDPKRLRQILLNLIGNAVKYTVHGAVKIQVTTTTDDRRIRIEVSDTGPGIPQERRALLFNDFERLELGSLSLEEGSGLGLSLARQLTTLMDGSIGYDDNPGGGSVFWFELPLVAARTSSDDQGPAGLTFCPGEASPASIKPLRVLVADDVAMNRDVAAAFLRSASHDVVCVDCGADAVIAATKSDFDIILMDVRMPGIDGLEATRRIRALQGPRGDVAIVALTAQVFTEQVKACTEAGMDCHLTKPFTIESLLAAITRGVAASRRRQAATLHQASPPARDQLGSSLPIIEEEALRRTTSVLAPEAVRSFLDTLAGLGDKLQRRLTTRDPSETIDMSLAEEAHALAGSAGMFGFERLVFVARMFERAVQTDVSKAATIAPDLTDALDRSLTEMRRRVSMIPF